MSSWQNTTEFIFGSREFRQQQVLEAGGFLCQCSECSLEADDLEENEKMRTEIKEKETEIEQLLMCGESHPVSRRSNMKKVLKLFQKKTNMVKNLNLRTEFVTAMIEFYRAAIKAKSMNISCKNDPDIYKQEALKYAKMFGEWRYSSLSLQQIFKVRRERIECGVRKNERYPANKHNLFVSLIGILFFITEIYIFFESWKVFI